MEKTKNPQFINGFLAAVPDAECGIFHVMDMFNKVFIAQHQSTC